MELETRRKAAIAIMVILINFIFLPLIYFSGSGVIKKSKMDGLATAHDVTFEETYHEGHYDSEGDYVYPYTSYKATYFYTVDGNMYSYSPSRTSESKSALASAKTIYYDKSNPSDCVAENETQIEPFITMICMYIAFMVIVVTFYLKMNRYSKK